MARVCLLSAIHPWVNPRLLKEADSLHAAGHDVIVGYRANVTWATARDEKLLATKPWRWHRIDFTREVAPFRWFIGASRQRLAELAVQRGIMSTRLDAEAYCRGFSAMLDWARVQRADLYIAHGQQTLAVAATAAGANEVPFAFDAEDLLAEEIADGLRAPWRREMIKRLEARYLPRAAYVSATSIPEANYLVTQYGLERVPIWHNCFRRSEVEGLVSPRERRHNPRVRLVWMSATIGPGRGLEDVFEALPHLEGRFELHLYGDVLPRFKEWFDGLLATRAKGVIVEVHPIPIGAAVMSALAEHDIGLTLDRNDCINRSTTICNKVFLYLQAGLACVATKTLGQASVLPGDPELGAIYEAGDVAGLVNVLRELIEPGRLIRVREAAWRAGIEQYNWDIEQQVYLESVARALRAKPSRGLARSELAVR